MIGKNEQTKEISNSCPDRIKLITEKRQYLKDSTAQAQDEIKVCFKRLVDVIKAREKQLLRQIDAIHTQQLSLVQSNLKLHSSIPSLIVNLSKENDLEKEVLQFGKIELSDINCIINDTEPYKVEDYQEANRDHVSFDKELQKQNFSSPSNSNSQNETIKTKTDSTKSWDLNSTELMNIQLIDEDFDDSYVTNSEISLSELFNSNLGNGESESYQKEFHFSTAEENSVQTRNKENACNIEKKKEFHKSHTDDSEHPKQVQQWLQQILIETETEPNVPEIEQFSEIPKSRAIPDFPLET
ncbi:uncharacterized protein LOC122502227 [Leptopilina heterotoma]|uniref:uncharacterized protein LOC122502227 n=1 Tax=Leptopilina heterotoma TaxID=63436 RepID=UPI001CA8999C|nr:uncharacterized protein LOC122502227 [Leptopilina heterotoma]